MGAVLAHWHFFVFVWVHHHFFGDLLGWLRFSYPGMPGGWYAHYGHWLIVHYGTGRDLLVAVRPY